MSLKWTKQIWASTELSHPTDRLMLLALADNANDEGLCWPSVETLRRRSSLKTRRGARKVLERLEAGTFIERVERPGRSNVYRLSGERLTPAKAQDQDPQPRTSVPQDRRKAERQDRGNRNTGTGRTIMKKSSNNSGPAPVVASNRERLVDLLTTRGVHPPEARRLTKRYDAERIGLQINHFDYRCSIGKPPHSGGWLLVAIRKEYPLPPPLEQRLRRHSPPPRAPSPAPPCASHSDSTRCARAETMQKAVASAMEQLEKSRPPERASPKTNRKPRRPWWAQEPIPPHVLEEIEHQRAGHDAAFHDSRGRHGLAPANPNSASAVV